MSFGVRAACMFEWGTTVVSSKCRTRKETPAERLAPLTPLTDAPLSTALGIYAVSPETLAKLACAPASGSSVEAPDPKGTVLLTSEPGALRLDEAETVLALALGLGVTEEPDGRCAVSLIDGAAHWMLTHGLADRLALYEELLAQAQRAHAAPLETVLPHRIGISGHPWSYLPSASQALLREALQERAMRPADPDIRLLRWLQQPQRAPDPRVRCEFTITVTIAADERRSAVFRPGVVPLLEADEARREQRR